MILRSMIDTDLYKLSMCNAVMKLYPHQRVKYKFINRGNHKFHNKFFARNLGWQLDAMKEFLVLTEYEAHWMYENLPFLDPVYIDFLKGYRYNPDELTIKHNPDTGNLSITIEGYWYRTILWEVPLMAIISEMYFDEQEHRTEFGPFDLTDLISDKAIKFEEELNVKVADFGTRRRYSYSNQDDVVQLWKKHAPNTFVGTSNVHLAHKHGVKAIGTQAHEWFMFHAAKYGFHQADAISLGRWVDVYNGALGIALTDTFTTEAFFKSFDLLYAKLFDGVRHDSGDPVRFQYKAQEHYEKLGIDPTLKTVVFSDALNFEYVKRIENTACKVKRSYGIGTNLTNDIPDVTPLNMVIKMSHAFIRDKWIPTIKLSDTSGKHTGDKRMIELAKQVLEIQ